MDPWKPVANRRHHDIRRRPRASRERRHVAIVLALIILAFIALNHA